METRDLTKDLLEMYAQMQDYVKYEISTIGKIIPIFYLAPMPYLADSVVIQIEEDVHEYLIKECPDGIIDTSMLGWY